MNDVHTYQSISLHDADADSLTCGARIHSRDGSHWAKLTIGRTEIVFFTRGEVGAAEILARIGREIDDALAAIHQAKAA
jgi:hypothetical protein